MPQPCLSNPKFFPPTRPIVRAVIPPTRLPRQALGRERIAPSPAAQLAALRRREIETRRIEAAARRVEIALAREARAGTTRAKLRAIIAEAAYRYGIGPEELTGKSRAMALCLIRDEVCWQCRRSTSASLPTIGKMLGGRDHTTIRSAILRHQARLDAEKGEGGE